MLQDYPNLVGVVTIYLTPNCVEQIRCATEDEFRKHISACFDDYTCYNWRVLRPTPSLLEYIYNHYGEEDKTPEYFEEQCKKIIVTPELLEKIDDEYYSCQCSQEVNPRKGDRSYYEEMAKAYANS